MAKLVDVPITTAHWIGGQAARANDKEFRKSCGAIRIVKESIPVDTIFDQGRKGSQKPYCVIDWLITGSHTYPEETRMLSSCRARCQAETPLILASNATWIVVPFIRRV